MTKTRLDYSDQMLLLEIEGYARDGYDDYQIAELMDVAWQTFSKHKNKKKADGSNSDLSDALRKGRRPLSVLVENALYKRAVGGFTLKTKVKRWLILPDGTQTDTEIIQETETEIPGDVNAQVKWLQTHKADMYNVQPTRIDLTSAGKAIEGPPRVTEIKHVQIAATEVTKTEVDV